MLEAARFIFRAGLAFGAAYVIGNTAKTAAILYDFNQQPRLEFNRMRETPYDVIVVLSADNEIDCKGKPIPNAIGRNRVNAGIEAFKWGYAERLLLLDGPPDAPAMYRYIQERNAVPLNKIDVEVNTPNTDVSIEQMERYLKRERLSRVLYITSRDNQWRSVILQDAHGLRSPKYKIDNAASEDLSPPENPVTNAPRSVSSLKVFGKSLHELGGILYITIDRDSTIQRTFRNQLASFKMWLIKIQNPDQSESSTASATPNTISVC